MGMCLLRFRAIHSRIVTGGLAPVTQRAALVRRLELPLKEVWSHRGHEDRKPNQDAKLPRTHVTAIFAFWLQAGKKEKPKPGTSGNSRCRESFIAPITIGRNTLNIWTRLGVSAALLAVFWILCSQMIQRE